jgi:hypothetical protein
MDALCETPGKGDTSWSLQFSCGPRPLEQLSKPERKRRNRCDTNINDIVKQLRENITLMLKAQRYLWKKAICQKENYNKVLDDFTQKESLLFKKTEEAYQIKNKKTIVKTRQIKKKLPIKIKTEVHSFKNKTLSPFVYGKEDFLERKNIYCRKKPSKSDSIFKQISFNYCNLAFERLY